MIWLLVHGEHLWWGVLGLFVLGGPVAWRRYLHRRARRHAARRLADWPEPLDALGGRAADGRVTLRGTLALEDDEGNVRSAAGEVVAGGGREPSARLVLELEDAVVAFEQAPVAVVGSVERCAGWWQEPAEAERTLRAGDRVVVHGPVTRGLTSDGYREQAPRWAFGPVGEGEDPPQVCFAGAPRVVGPGPKSLAWGVVWAVALLVGAGYVLGALFYEAAAQLHYDDPREPGRVLGLASVAAATPFHRDLAVDLAARSLYPDTPDRAAMVSTAADLERGMTGSCTGLLQALWRDGSLSHMPEVAERCGDADSVRLGARGALLDGQLERGVELARRAPAEEIAEPDPEALWTEVLLYLLAGDHGRSAASLRHVASLVEDAELRGAYECIARSLYAYASGDEEPDLGPLDEAASGPARQACVPLVLNHVEPGTRQLMRDVVYTDALDHRFEPLADELAMEERSDVELPLAAPFDHPADVVVGRILRERAPLGLDAAVLERLEGEMGPGVRASRAAASSRLAGFLAAMGDTGRALALLEEAEADLRAVVEAEGEGSGWARALGWIPVRRAAVHLRAGDADAAASELGRADREIAGAEPTRELAAVLSYVRGGDVSALSEVSEDDLGPSGLELAVETGDGEALVDWLRRHDRWLTTPVVQLAAPHVRERRAEVTAWLHRDTPAPLCPTMRSCRLDAVAADAHSRALAARALGDEGLAERLERRARALREALTRRDVALPWALLGRVHGPPDDAYSVTP